MFGAIADDIFTSLQNKITNVTIFLKDIYTAMCILSHSSIKFASNNKLVYTYLGVITHRPNCLHTAILLKCAIDNFVMDK